MAAGADAPHQARGERQDQGPGEAQPAPDLADALHALGQDGKAGLKATTDALKAFRVLVAADLSLARSAFGRALAFTAVAIVFGCSSWLLLMAALIAAVQAAGLSWLASMLIAAGLSVAVTALAGVLAIRYFEHTRMQATRRQLARLGFGELSSLMPNPGSDESCAAAAARHAATPTHKHATGVDVTPP